MDQRRMTDTIVQLNKYPPERYNVLIPVTSMQAMSNMQRIIVNEVRLDTAVDQNGGGRDIYKEKSSGKFAITKVGGMKLAAAANISIVASESAQPDVCAKCIQMAKATGKAQPCGPCPHAYDVKFTVTIRVPEPSGGFRLISGSKEIDCTMEKAAMSDSQYRRFLPHRASIAESKALMRSIRTALGLAPTYDLRELEKPFVIAHIVPNLDAPEIREALANSALRNMGLLFELPGNSAPAQKSLPQGTAEPARQGPPALPEAGTYDETERPDDGHAERMPWDAADGGIYCEGCGQEISATTGKGGRQWTPEDIRGYSERNFGRCLCPSCQHGEKRVG
ncbi:MAG: hypothetical protein LBS32_07665 [Clostridiales Family XIII bacterium]|nr:hypothetical protein [Clostridiales Family XIII bacterium]